MTRQAGSPLTVKHLDGAAMRVLAHPLRMRIVGLLRADGPATASGLAGRLGVSSGLTSYHLRALADADFVEDDPDHAIKGRERWWRASQDMTSWRASEAGSDPDAVAAEQWLAGFAARRSMEWLDDWLDRRPTADPAWQEVTATSDYRVEVNPEELDELLLELDAVLQAWMTRKLPAEDPDREDVVVLLQAFPRNPDA
jgi:DNA-binding transcriptional ArsR family regulator